MKKIFVDFNNGNDANAGISPDTNAPENLGPIRTITNLNNKLNLVTSPREIKLTGFTSINDTNYEINPMAVQMINYLPKELILVNALQGDWFTPSNAGNLWGISFQPSDFLNTACFKKMAGPLLMSGFSIVAATDGTIKPGFTGLCEFNNPLLYMTDGYLAIDLLLLENLTNGFIINILTSYKLNMKRVGLLSMPFYTFPTNPGDLTVFNFETPNSFVEECMVIFFPITPNSRIVRISGGSGLYNAVFYHCSFFTFYNSNIIPDPSSIVLVEDPTGIARFYENLYVFIDINTMNFTILTSDQPNGAVVKDPNPGTDLYSWLAKVGGGATPQQIVDAIKADPLARRPSRRDCDDGSEIAKENKIKLK